MRRSKLTAMILAGIILGSLTSCGADMQTPEVEPTVDLDFNLEFFTAQMSFSLNMLREIVQDNPNANVLISPYSAMQALAMTANGANGNTRTEMEQALGGIPLESLNKTLKTLRTALPDSKNCKFKTANAVWVNNTDKNLKLLPGFQELVESDYNAKITCAPFDESACQRINHWCSEQTDRMIPEIVSGPISSDSAVFLLNAICFDAKWSEPYYDTSPGTFTSASGEKQKVQMMQSDEKTYLSAKNAVGFMKDYAGKNYAFAAILPNKDMTPAEWLSEVQPDDLRRMLKGPNYREVYTELPEFCLECSTNLSPILSSIGMPSAFNSDSADFSGMAENVDTPLYITQVLQKTYIDVNPKGTRAAAVIDFNINTAIEGLEVNEIILDRPFIYMIVEKDTMTPLFIGILNTMPET